ncbi:iron-sulfur cluster biosynthesis family protein [Oceanobacillus damuensis]|uniref:iron-sulfur cluster biosynthesis family protein n=1 Tax=Oceanobacillus damuensis TaxID=937928 RepID=UPI000835EB6E|nr:iron-sulfur cluster biosynthesis family protein [Oceanobacillus damuensis]
MKIDVRDHAVEEISKIALTENEGIRILAEFAGTCSIATEIELSIEKAKEDDLLITEKGINFLVPEQSKASLPEEIILDFKNGMGFKISSKSETLGYNFRLNDRRS